MSSNTGATPDYAPPELGVGQAGPHSKASDDYSLALLVCELLYCGTHPFVGVPKDLHIEEPTPAANIRVHRSRFVDPTKINVPARMLPLDILPPNVLALARQAFGPGHRDPQQRPPAMLWVVRLCSSLGSLTTCAAEPRHVYSRLALEECPWCRQVAHGHQDPFVPSRRQRAPEADPTTQTHHTETHLQFPADEDLVSMPALWLKGPAPPTATPQPAQQTPQPAQPSAQPAQPSAQPAQPSAQPARAAADSLPTALPAQPVTPRFQRVPRSAPAPERLWPRLVLPILMVVVLLAAIIGLILK